MTVQISHKKFAVWQYYQMLESGILTEQDRVELIEGEIVQMSPIGPKHAACGNRLQMLFSRALPAGVFVASQYPVRLSDVSEPEPDLALLRGEPEDYENGHPGPADVLALIEVSVSTIEFDRTVKAPLYARSGIRELWILDLSALALEVYRSPSPAGYQQVRVYRRGQSIALQALPEIAFEVEVLLMGKRGK